MAAVTIPTSNYGKVTRSGVGFEPHQTTNKSTGETKLTGFGGAAPIASRMAEKRACAQFKLGLYLYEK